MGAELGVGISTFSFFSIDIKIHREFLITSCNLTIKERREKQTNQVHPAESQQEKPEPRK